MRSKALLGYGGESGEFGPPPSLHGHRVLAGKLLENSIKISRCKPTVKFPLSKNFTNPGSDTYLRCTE